MGILNKIKLDANEKRLLGCRWAIQGNKLFKLEKDLFAENVKYSYVPAEADSNVVREKVGRIVAGKISNKILRDSCVEGELIYLPTLKVGDKLIAMNTSHAYLIDAFFPEGYTTIDSSMHFMTLDENSINCSDAHPLAVDMSNYEIDYILDLKGLDREEQYHIVFIPFYIGTIKSRLYSFKFLYKAYGDSCTFVSDLGQREYVSFDIFLLLSFSIICYVIAINCLPPLDKNFLHNYAEWVNPIVYLPDTIQNFLDIDNVLLLLIWYPIKLILYLIAIIIALGILPALATLLPFIIAMIISCIFRFILMRIETKNNFTLWNAKNPR